MINSMSKNYKQRSHSTGISFSSGYFLNQDYILAVEGSTDRNFYQKYTKLQILISPEIQNAHGKAIDCRSKILTAIDGQKNKGLHWYGIMDSDYSLPTIPPSIKIGNDIFFTDANSLETMLVKYAGIKNFEKLIESINHQLIKRYCLNNDILLLALEFSYRIGCLRKKNDNNRLNLNFKDVLVSSNNYYNFLQFSKPKTILKNGKKKLEYTVSFDFGGYRNSLIQKSNVNPFATVGLASIGNDPFSIGGSNWKDYCQGHDIIHFIVALNKIHQTISNDNKELTASTHDKLDKKIIENYKIKWFETSKIAKWLKNI